MSKIPKKKASAGPDNILIEFDQAGAEWVCVAYLSGDANMIDVIKRGEKPHVKTGALITGLSEELVKKEYKLVGMTTDRSLIEELRAPMMTDLADATFLPGAGSIYQIGKKCNHALNYDEQFKTFALNSECPEDEAKKLVHLYKYVAYPSIPIWHEGIRNQLRDNRTLTNCFGSKVRLLGAWDHDLFRKAYAYLPQSTVVEITLQGMRKCYDSRDKYVRRYDLLGEVHDSLVGQYPWKDASAIAHMSQLVAYDYLSPLCTYGARQFRIGTEMKMGFNWGTMMEVKLSKDHKELTRNIKAAIKHLQNAKT